MPWQDKVRLLHLLWEVGLLWVRFTGGEPLIDRDFADTYTLAHRSGMLIQILTNGSRLHRLEVIGHPHRFGFDWWTHRAATGTNTASTTAIATADSHGVCTHA
ncbi:hypothetical protein ACFTT0_08190 [Streptomyces bauhiniae]|uniref:hypothetical protein n=1 Tax=Streptomyces bauhiniae TaxID=2340725 RepID=UPI0036408220